MERGSETEGRKELKGREGGKGEVDRWIDGERERDRVSERERERDREIY